MAAQAIVLMGQLINRQRTKAAQWEEFSRIGLFLDEVANTPIPHLPQYLAESRGLGRTVCFAAQAGSQLDAICGLLHGKVIRDLTPAALIMYKTRLGGIDQKRRRRLVNWGYAACDAALRSYVNTALPSPTGFPFPDEGLD